MMYCRICFTHGVYIIQGNTRKEINYYTALILNGEPIKDASFIGTNISKEELIRISHDYDKLNICGIEFYRKR